MARTMIYMCAYIFWTFYNCCGWFYGWVEYKRPKKKARSNPHNLSNIIIFTYARDYPASCTVGTGSFPGVKAARAWCWPHTPPSSAEVKKELRYTSTHPVGPPGPVTGFPLPLCNGHLSKMKVTVLTVVTKLRTGQLWNRGSVWFLAGPRGFWLLQNTQTGTGTIHPSVEWYRE